MIHLPRLWTRFQNSIMQPVVAFIWSNTRSFEVKQAADELTENIAQLEELAPCPHLMDLHHMGQSTIDELDEQQC